MPGQAVPAPKVTNVLDQAWVSHSERLGWNSVMHDDFSSLSRCHLQVQRNQMHKRT